MKQNQNRKKFCFAFLFPFQSHMPVQPYSQNHSPFPFISSLFFLSVSSLFLPFLFFFPSLLPVFRSKTPKFQLAGLGSAVHEFSLSEDWGGGARTKSNLEQL